MDEVNEIGVFWSLVSALGLGFVRMGMDMKWQRPGCEDLLLGKSDPRPFLTKNFPYLYFSVFLFVYTCITCVIISRIFKNSATIIKAPPGTTWSSQSKSSSCEESEEISDLKKNKIVSDDETENIQNIDQSETFLVKNRVPRVSSCSEVKPPGFFARLCGMDASSEEIIGLGDKNVTKSGYPMDANGARSAGMYFDTEISKIEVKTSPFWSKFVDLNALICLLACFGLWYYYW